LPSGGSTPHVAIIGAGFCGLAAGYELSKRGICVTLFEKDQDAGGLAGSFQVGGIPGVRLEKFYHHWFNHDRYIMSLAEELGVQDQVVFRPTLTGMYYGGKFYRLSSPTDVLRFKPLPLSDRIRLGLLTLQARWVKDWRCLEKLTAAQWLRQMGGERVYQVVWEPLLRGKFGEYAEEVSAVWFWNKLKLRGGSRGKGGKEQLAYYRGGFAAFADRIVQHIESANGRVALASPVEGLQVEDGRVTGVKAAGQHFKADAVIATPALPVIAELVEPYVLREYTLALKRVQYLANLCLVLELDRSLSDIYWLNVNDPDFPFVAVIEHTNFEPSESYGRRVIVYLSKYLRETSPLFAMNDEELLNYSIPYLKKMFRDFDSRWILDYHVWRARYSQPIVERHFSELIVKHETPLEGLYIASMAQIYPEDRGSNYAVREGRSIGRLVATVLNKASSS
jgi:protoporphyrinogen oxidase